MAKFTPKTEEQILTDLAAYITSNTPLTDLNPGSVLVTILEAIAAEDAEQYMQMLEIISAYSLDTVTGTDLDKRASEYNVTRLTPQKATGTVTISDTSFTKVAVNLSTDFPAPAAGQTFLNVEKTVAFPASGTLIIGRGTDNFEVINYSSIDNTNAAYTQFVLSAGLNNAHNTSEQAVLSQGSNRIIAAGTIVQIPSTDISDEIKFVTKNIATILVGEESVTGVLVEALAAGTQGNAPANSIKEFESAPFANATVRNTLTFTNGSNAETDAQLRDRVKSTIQTLSKGTKNAIELAAIGTEFGSQRVVSASLLEQTSILGIGKLFIDDGAGFSGTKAGVGIENTLVSATGGEKFLQVGNFPIVQGIFINNLNNKINFDEGSGAVTATLADGFYTLKEFLTEVQTKMNAAGSNIYQVTETDEEKIKISANAAFDLLWKTGANGLDNGLRNAGKVMGFSINGDLENKSLYTADFQPTIILLAKNKRTLTGVTLTNGSTATTGVSSTVQVGDYIKITTDDNTAWARVESVGPVVLSWNYEGAGGSATNAEVVEFLHTDKYTLNRFIGQLELNDALVSGDKITLGDISFRARVESGDAENYDISGDASLSNNATFTQGSTTVTGTDLDDDVAEGDWIKLDADSGGSLTGTLTFTQGSQVVTGSGTAFTTELAVGDFIKLDSDDNTKFARVSVINSNTSLTLNTGYLGTTGSGASSNSDPWVQVDSVDSATEVTLKWAYAGAGGAAGASSVVKPGALVLTVDGGANQTILFKPQDFDTLGAGTAVEVKDRLNMDLSGATAFVSPQTGNDKVKILSDEFGSVGSIRVLGGTANTALDFSTTLASGIDGYQHFTELVQEVQHKIDGNAAKSYEQVRAAGTQVNVLTPELANQTFSMIITPIPGVTVNSLRPLIREKVVNYVNNLRIGQDVILSEVISAVQEVVGVFDVDITSPASNVNIADGQLARVVDSSITII